MADDSVRFSFDSTGTGTGTRTGLRNDLDPDHAALFGVRIGDLNLLLPARDVQVVTDIEPPTRVPAAPDYIVGLVPYGDGAMAILDLAKFLGIARAHEINYADMSAHRVVGVRSIDLEAGLLCDQATGVVRVPRALFQPNAVIKGGRVQEFLSEEVEIGGVRHGVINLKLLLQTARVRSRREV